MPHICTKPKSLVSLNSNNFYSLFFNKISTSVNRLIIGFYAKTSRVCHSSCTKSAYIPTSSLPLVLSNNKMFRITLIVLNIKDVKLC